MTHIKDSELFMSKGRFYIVCGQTDSDRERIKDLIIVPIFHMFPLSI